MSKIIKFGGPNLALGIHKGVVTDARIVLKHTKFGTAEMLVVRYQSEADGSEAVENECFVNNHPGSPCYETVATLNGAPPTDEFDVGDLVGTRCRFEFYIDEKGYHRIKPLARLKKQQIDEV